MGNKNNHRTPPEYKKGTTYSQKKIKRSQQDYNQNDIENINPIELKKNQIIERVKNKKLGEFSFIFFNFILMLILPTFLSFSYFFFFIKKTKQKKLKLKQDFQ